MAESGYKVNSPQEPEQNCDVRVWCEECERSEYEKSGDKYLCASCGRIMTLDHQVGHEIFPHVSGDYRKLH